MFYWKEIDDLLESRPLVKTYLRKFVGKKLILFFFRWWDIDKTLRNVIQLYYLM